MYQEPQEPPAMRSRTRGLRQVRRWSNWTAAALIAGTVVTTGYLARTSHPGAAAAGTAGVAAGAGVAGEQPGTAAGAQRPCVSVPVATSGGSGVTRQTVVRSCGTGTSAPVVITTGRTHEGGDS